MATLGNPALVLNADFRPLSYYPLSLWSWQDAIKAVFLERVSIIENYDKEVHSPSLTIKIPSVIALKDYIALRRRPAFTRFNVFLRDQWSCQYCTKGFKTQDLTFDHVIPRSRGGRTSWDNIVAACRPCNTKKGSKMPNEVDMYPKKKPEAPSIHMLQEHDRFGVYDFACKNHVIGFVKIIF